LYGEHANIFSPTFRLHDDLEAVHASILKWCDDNYKRLSEQDLPALLATVAKLPKIGKENINLTGKLTLQRGSVGKLETESLKTPKGTLDADLAASINKAHAKVQQMQATVHGIEAKMERSILKNGSVTLVGEVRVDRFESPVGNVTDLNVTTMNGMLLDGAKSRARAVDQNEVLNITVEVEELVIEGGMEAQLLNDVPISSLLHTNDAVRLPNLTIHAKDVILEAGLHVAKTIDGVEFTPRHVVFHEMNQTLVGNLAGRNLVVRHLDTLSLNGNPVEETLQNLHELVEKTNQPSTFNRIDAENLTLPGAFNGLDFLALADITLKKHGDQRLEAEYDIETLTTPQLITNSTISGEPLSNLVRTDNGTFVVNQDVLFAAPLEVNDLIVEKRINNINVQNGKLDMLLKRSDSVQVISGDKVFERLRLMGSIELQGKIRSKSLSKMNPIATVDQDLLLEGDYTINGNVTVKRLLNASDIFGRSKVHSVGKLLKEGLTVGAVVPFPVDFRQHIKAENLEVSKLNDLDPRHFVKANVEENQVITGHKVFAQDLTVKVGLCDAEKVNGVSLRALNTTMLKTHGDQEVHGRIHFSRLVAKKVTTPGKDAKLAAVKVAELLNSNSQQILPTKFTVNGTVHVKTALEVVHLNTSGQLFGHTMKTLIEDTVVALPETPVKIGGDKYFTSCEFVDLKMTAPTATFCNVNLNSLKDRIGDLGSDLLIQESVHFTSPMQVKHLNAKE
jgi:cytoskeletal protein CcmA (bactofilin family)